MGTEQTNAEFAASMLATLQAELAKLDARTDLHPMLGQAREQIMLATMRLERIAG